MLGTLLLLSTATAATDVLFVGNSYTFYNNLESVVADVFTAAGDTATTARLTSGGLSLANHAAFAADTSSDWHTRLVTEADQREWVVLQDQSQIPGFPRGQAEWIASRDAAIELNGLIADAGAETMFFLTWGYVDGDAGNEWLYPDYSTMQEQLAAGYLDYAEACESPDRPVWVAPVGPAFGYIRSQAVDAGEDPLDDGSLFRALYSGDGSHPAGLGTQLAAYVFFASLTGQTPVGLPAPDHLDAGTVLLLQEAAAAVVFDTTDAFVFPWEELEEPSDTADPDPDTGESESAECATDTASPEDEGGGNTSSVDGPSSSGLGMDSSTSSEEEKSGCSYAGRTGTNGVFLLLLPLILIRRNGDFVQS